MKQQLGRVQILFFIGIILSSTIVSISLVDPITLSRHSFLLVTVIFSFLLLLTSKNWKGISFTLADYAFISFLIWTVLGTIQSHDLGDALQGIIKFSLFFSVYKVTQSFVKYNLESFAKGVGRVFLLINLLSVILFLLAIFTVLPKCANFEDMYLLKGIHGHKNLVASYFVFSIPYLFLYAIKSAKKYERILTIISFILSFVLVLFIEGRAAILSLIVLCISSLFIFPQIKLVLKRNYKLLVSTTVLIIVGTILLKLFVFCGEVFPNHDTHRNAKTDTYYYDRFAEDRVVMTSTAYERFALWEKSFEIIKDHPISGVGFNNWRYEYPKHKLTGLIRSELENVKFYSPHNDYIWLASETGVIGLLLYLLFIILIVFPKIKTIKNASWVEKAAFLTVIAVFTNAFLDFPHQKISHGLILFISLGILSYSANTKLLITSRKYVFFLFIMCSLLFSFVLSQRILGSYNSALLLRDKNASVAIKLQRCENAISPFYTSNAFAMPINWYIGNLQVMNKNYTQALYAFKKAYNISPFNKYVLQDYASAVYLHKDTVKAEELYSEAIRISPMFDEARLNYATILLKQKKNVEALIVLEQIVDTIQPKYKALHNYLLKETSTK